MQMPDGMVLLRWVAVGVALLLYGKHAAVDYQLHKHVRKPSLPEMALHGIIGAAALSMTGSALMGNRVAAVYASLVMVLAGAADEYGFHHGLPPEENLAHAKGHMALMALAVVSLATVMLPLEMP